MEDLKVCSTTELHDLREALLSISHNVGVVKSIDVGFFTTVITRVQEITERIEEEIDERG